MENNLDVKKIKILSCGIKDCDENWHWDTGEGGFCDYDLWTVFRGRGALTYGGVRWEASVGDSLLLTPNKQVHRRTGYKRPPAHHKRAF